MDWFRRDRYKNKTYSHLHIGWKISPETCTYLFKKIVLLACHVK